MNIPPHILPIGQISWKPQIPSKSASAHTCDRLTQSPRFLLALACLAIASALHAQTPVVPPTKYTIEPFGKSNGPNSPLTQPTLSPGVLTLLELEGRFSQDVLANGGKAFAKWFADDAVTLNNGLLPVLGRASIAAQAQWDPKQYQLSWVAQGAQMGPSNDMGFTWGHYEGHSIDKAGQPVTKSGRYMTVWKKQNGQWKVAMDASADEPPGAAECCTLPKPGDQAKP